MADFVPQDSPSDFTRIFIPSKDIYESYVIKLSNEELDTMFKSKLEKDCFWNKAYMGDELSFPSSLLIQLDLV